MEPSRPSPMPSNVAAVTVPARLLCLLAPESRDPARQIAELVAIELFRRGEASSGYLANVLGMDRWAFIQLLGEHGVPYVDMTAEELQADVEALEAYLDGRPYQRRA